MKAPLTTSVWECAAELIAPDHSLPGQQKGAAADEACQHATAWEAR